ncbi:hypothetical protein [Variovorax sp. PAMC 28711]|uniref:hypothetical protein n=1 Tax=Variovorax sp. PAMC 28711 TaxID=1795631 RepID=UPI0009E919A8|nr:hypothetical protein [Variovorax sp. PAMC 28711]
MLRLVCIAWTLAAFGTASQASCDSGLAERMHAKLHPDRELDRDKAGCKAWPGFLGRYIVVLPLPRTASPEGSTDYDLDVMVVQQADNGNTDRARISSRVFESRALVEDAVRISDIQIDTARYILAADTRAFGLRVKHSGASRANPYANEELSLYVPQGEHLRKVLDGLETARERGEWDTSCAGKFEQLRMSVALSRTTANRGYADLLLSQTRIESHAVPTGDGECAEREQPASFKTLTLQYDGTRYAIPPALRLVE